ncbi:MAG: histidine triad nucleotide-binding protein [Longimicrobiales bacterium]
MGANCLFCRIARGEIPAKLAHQDDRAVAFHDIDPKAPVHVLVIPRKHIASVAALADDEAGEIGHLYTIARRLAEELGVADSGYRLVINAGKDAGQSVDHIHLHVLGGRSFHWPPG